MREFFDEIKDGWRPPQYEHKPAALARPKIQLDWRLKLGRKETQRDANHNLFTIPAIFARA